MIRISKNFLACVLIVGIGLVFGGLKYYQSSSTKTVKQAPVDKIPPRAKGNPKANLKIVEFIDFQCPACAKGAKLIHEYMEKYPEKIYLEVRYYPLSMHQHGVTSARWAECAARQDKFWPFLDPLLEKQADWAVLNDPTPPFNFIAKEAGLDPDVLKTCLADPAIDEVINTDVEEGKMRKVSSTPSYLINHELIVGPKSLQAKMDEILGVKTEETKDPAGK